MGQSPPEVGAAQVGQSVLRCTVEPQWLQVGQLMEECCYVERRVDRIPRSGMGLSQVEHVRRRQGVPDPGEPNPRGGSGPKRSPYIADRRRLEVGRLGRRVDSFHGVWSLLCADTADKTLANWLRSTAVARGSPASSIRSRVASHDSNSGVGARPRTLRRNSASSKDAL